MNDDELLDLLRSAIATEAVEPHPEAMLFLHRAIDGARPCRPRHRFKRVAGSCLVGAGVLAGAGGAFAASGAVLPEPVRAVAHAIGLPVDSPAVAEARAARRALHISLQRHDPSAITAASERLRHALDGLSVSERADLSDADRLLDQVTDSTSKSQTAADTEPGPAAPSTTDSDSATTVDQSTTSTDQESSSTTEAATSTSTTASEDSTNVPTTESP